ncbi:MAG: hypothetical protein KDD45_16610 [Bdellovibrionales bacterium]|nr:hypothetical protein [Bdellovibrionales bacterium]
MEGIRHKITKLYTSISSFLDHHNLWRVNYKFSSKWKHPDIIVKSDNKLKAGNGQGYRFGIMEPEV